MKFLFALLLSVAVEETRPPFVCRTSEAGVEAFGPPEEGASCPLEGPCDDPLVRETFSLGPHVVPKVVRVRILIFREDDGSNPAASAQDVEREMQQLNEHFAPLRVRFEHVWEFIDDSQFRYTANFPEEIQMKLTYAQFALRRCHVYVTGSSANYGAYPWWPTATGKRGGIVINELPFTTPQAVLTHEFGHNLGLWHTFRGSDEVDPCSECYEGADGAEGDTTGDYCSDTPPTPLHVSCSDPTGSDTCSGLPWGDVQETNFMSYSIGCWSQFTQQQAARMHCWLGDQLATWWRCGADLDDDGDIDRADLEELRLAFGPNPGHPADLDGSGVVDARDARLLIASHRACP